MAEAFLEEIYRKSIIIQYLKETIEYSQKNLLPFAMRTWSEKVLPLVSSLDAKESAGLPLKEMLWATENLKNSSLFTSIVEDEIIPAVYRYLSPFQNIDVSDNGYCLKSTRTGFLTLIDENLDLYFHSANDPMWEAHILAQEIYAPCIIEYVFIGGVGLGYLPYQVYSLSHESAKIKVLDTEKTIVDLGYNYGVLGWIPCDDITVLIGEEAELLEQFYNYSLKENVRCVITPYREDKYVANLGTRVVKYMINREPKYKYKNLYGINLRKNLEQGLISAEKYRPSKATDECVIVAAGPSLDENIDFLMNDCNDRVIIAVNTVVRKLIQRGINLDAVVALDANDQLAEHISGVESNLKDIPLVMNLLTNWKFVRHYPGPKFAFQTEDMMDTYGGIYQNYPLWEKVGVTVSSAAMELAYRLGAKKIFLVGLDLGYPEGKMYADGAAHTKAVMDSEGLMVKAVDGSFIRTTSVFDQFKKGIERQIRKHNDVSVINLSKHGALIEGCVDII